MIRFDPPSPPDARSIPDLQKNGSDANTVQSPVQMLMQILVQNNLQNVVQPFVQKIAPIQKRHRNREGNMERQRLSGVERIMGNSAFI